jgi:hypothetical protein
VNISITDPKHERALLHSDTLSHFPELSRKESDEKFCKPELLLQHKGKIAIDGTEQFLKHLASKLTTCNIYYSSYNVKFLQVKKRKTYLLKQKYKDINNLTF